MSSDANPDQPSRTLSVRRHVDRKILKFSVCVGAIATVLSALVYASTLIPSVKHARSANLDALDGISCSDNGCDASKYNTSYSEKPDYVLDAKTGYFIDFRETSDNPLHFDWLDFCKPETGEDCSHLFSKECEAGGSGHQ